jgi:hypothetical protein
MARRILWGPRRVWFVLGAHTPTHHTYFILVLLVQTTLNKLPHYASTHNIQHSVLWPPRTRRTPLRSSAPPLSTLPRAPPAAVSQRTKFSAKDFVPGCAPRDKIFCWDTLFFLFYTNPTGIRTKFWRDFGTFLFFLKFCLSRMGQGS